MHRSKIIILFVLVLVMMCLFVPTVWAANPLVNMNVVDEEVGPVLHTLAKISGMNIVIDEAVTGKITVELSDIPLDTAMDIVTKMKGLTYQKVGNVIVVGPMDKMSKNFGDIHIFKMQYAKASDVAVLIGIALRDQIPSTPAAPQPAMAQVAQSVADRIKVDDVTNSVVFIGSPDETAQIQKILAEIDVPYQQVSVEAQVVSISKSASKDLGIAWTLPTNAVAYSNPNSSGSSSGTSGTTTTNGTDGNTMYTGTIQYGKSPAGTPYQFYYQAKINALVTKGDATVLSKPKVTTINGKEATINIGEEIAIPSTTTANNTTTSSFDYRKVGIILKYTPRINADGYITTTLHTEVSAPVYDSNLKAYNFTNRSADTQVRLKDGETMVIGGLIGKNESNSMSKIPFLADLPIVGRLFQTNSKSKTEDEVIIFLTAHIVK